MEGLRDFGWVFLISLGLSVGGCHTLGGVSNEAIHATPDRHETNTSELEKSQPMPTRVLVKFKSSVNPEMQAQIYERYGLKEIGDIRSIGVKILEVPAGEAPQAIVWQLRQNEAETIEYVEPDAIVSIPEPPPDE